MEVSSTAGASTSTTSRCCLLSFVVDGVGVYLDLDILVFTRATAPLAFFPDVHFWATLERVTTSWRQCIVHITDFVPDVLIPD